MRRAEQARCGAALAVLALTGCAQSSHPASQVVRTAPSASAAVLLSPAPVPAGWHRVAHLAFDPVHPKDSLVGWTLTARSSVRWVLSCQTVRGTSSDVVMLQVQDLDHEAKSMNFSPSSPGWLQCPVGAPGTKQGVFAVRPHGRSVDVNLQLWPVSGTDTVTDGSVLFRVDAFERDR